MPTMNGQQPSRGRASTRKRIVIAAEGLFARYGYEATSVRDIARECGLTDAALYYYFPSKRELIRALVEDYNALPGPDVPAARGQMSYTLLDRAVDAMLDEFAATATRSRLVRGRAVAGDAQAIEARRRRLAAWRAALLSNFDVRFRPEDAERLTDAFLTLLKGVILLRMVQAAPGPGNADGDRVFREEVKRMVRVAVPLERFVRRRAASA